MKYFTSEFISFFKDLELNNNTDWFHANKKRYEPDVKKPFIAFIGDLITEIRKYEPALNIEAKDCILRINKDVRFSKDKSPYNLYYTAFVSKGGRKDKSIPGIYLRFAPDMIGIMGGFYGGSNEQIASIRSRIVAEPKKFEALIKEKLFVDAFDTVQGEAIKRVPAELKLAAESQSLVLNKQWYVIARRKPELMLSDGLMNEMMNYYKIMKPLNEFLIGAIR